MGIFRRKAARQKHKKTGGFFFLMLIPTLLIGSLLNLVNLIVLMKKYQVSGLSWGLFGFGLIGAFSFIIGMNSQKFRTFIHELKHAVVVIFTGNKIREFHVDKHVGHVKYDLLVNKAYLAPLIILAPYFLPIISFPILVACVVVGEKYLELALVSLGAALGADILMGYQEIHSNQSDLQKVFGGFLFAGLFIVVFQLFWTSFCLLWVNSGTEAYKIWAENGLELLRDIFDYVVSYVG